MLLLLEKPLGAREEKKVAPALIRMMALHGLE
jgi:hypothetical protein